MRPRGAVREALGCAWLAIFLAIGVVAVDLIIAAWQ